MVAAVESDIRDELRRFIETAETPVLETVLAVAKSFEHGLMADDEYRYYRPHTPSWARTLCRADQTAISQRVDAGGHRAILNADGTARMLVRYRLDGEPLRYAEYERSPEGDWSDGNGPLRSQCFADLEVFYMDLVDSMERCLNVRNGNSES